MSVLLIELKHGVVMAKVHHFHSLNADTRRSYLTDTDDTLVHKSFVTVQHFTLP